ncbi:uncharacterized protein LOC119682946 [Teleopsis dalmanni]|uniref:uncharacterized protein LOC119681432 n=1 Tax=Teleopsis dalmanni TaxID=139649 RepID=UPI0018CE276F|nr:uncharacterized protein LOC119681432 [Teleopsis dalmanni]XP_037952449.1 uncharacterized protein LOC119682946 [Teleopsis dalmanni]
MHIIFLSRTENFNQFNHNLQNLLTETNMDEGNTLINVAHVLESISNELIIEQNKYSPDYSQTAHHCVAQWYYYHRSKWFKYERKLNARIEKAYQEGAKRMYITSGPHLEYIDFKAMKAVCDSAHIPNAFLKREEVASKAISPLPPLSKFVIPGLAIAVANDIVNKSLSFLDNRFPDLIDTTKERIQKKQNAIMTSSKYSDSKMNSSGFDIKKNGIKTIKINKPIHGSLIERGGNELYRLTDILVRATEENSIAVGAETIELLESTKKELELLNELSYYSFVKE